MVTNLISTLGLIYSEYVGLVQCIVTGLSDLELLQRVGWQNSWGCMVAGKSGQQTVDCLEAVNCDWWYC